MADDSMLAASSVLEAELIAELLWSSDSDDVDQCPSMTAHPTMIYEAKGLPGNVTVLACF